MSKKISFEKLITTISSNFINLTIDRIDDCINNALAMIGEFAGVDRSYIFLFYDNGMKMDNTHEWCARGIEPQIENLKGIAVDEELPWFSTKIKGLQVFHVPSVNDLPKEAAAEKEHFQMQDIQSLIVVPMVISGSLIGFAGFDSVCEKKSWSENDIALLKIAGEIFTNALLRKQADERINRLYSIQTAVRNINQVLLRVKDEWELFQQICNELMVIGDFRFAWIGLIEKGSFDVKPVAWTGVEDGYLSSIKVAWDDSEFGKGPTGIAIKAGLPFIVNDAENDPGYESWRAEALKRGYRASMALPLKYEDEVIGALSVYSAKKNAFDDEEVKFLTEVAGDIVVGVRALRLEKELQEREKRYKQVEENLRQFFEQNEDAIILLEPLTCKIIDANSAAVKLYGYFRHELIEHDPSIFMEPEEYERFRQIVGCIDRMESLLIRQMNNIRKDGTKIVVSMRKQLIKLQERDVIYCSIRDITDKIHLEEEMKSVQAKLIHTNKMASLGTLVSGIVHEINNPNNFIMSNASLLSDIWQDVINILKEHHNKDGNGELILGGLPFNEMCEYVPMLHSGIIEGSLRIKNIVDNLKDFARQDKASVEGKVNINKIITTSTSILRNQIKRFTNNCHARLEEDLPYVKGSSQQIEQVVINLIMNALQALPDKNRGVFISTSLDKDSGLVKIEVKDEGIGMSKETLAHLTEPFFSTKLDSGGTGLGLSISSSIIKEHKGSLEFESEINKGTTVTVKLPTFSTP